MQLDLTGQTLNEDGLLLCLEDGVERVIVNRASYDQLHSKLQVKVISDDKYLARSIGVYPGPHGPVEVKEQNG